VATTFPTTNPQTATPLTLDALGEIVLRQSDEDRARRWGGIVRQNLSGTPIADLQQALADVGVYTSTVDGQFGPGTLAALRRFQWFVINSRYRLRVTAGAAPVTGVVTQYPVNARVLFTGQCDAVTATELRAWTTGFFRTTSLLVRVPVSRFTNITRAATFTTLAYPQATDDEVLVNGNFTGLDTLDRVARGADLQLRLNQTFRVQGIAPRGAVVAPATRSQHLIGHAVDLNIVVAGTVIVSSQFTARTAPKEATDFVASAKAGGLRWGGDFGDTDPPHYDQPVTVAEDYDMNFFFCQRAYAAQHPLRQIGVEP
jgi:peptidoglycan hydrolase-like protein with peptidoglycan-binding domain